MNNPQLPKSPDEKMQELIEALQNVASRGLIELNVSYESEVLVDILTRNIRNGAKRKLSISYILADTKLQQDREVSTWDDPHVMYRRNNGLEI